MWFVFAEVSSSYRYLGETALPDCDTPKHSIYLFYMVAEMFFNQNRVIESRSLFKIQYHMSLVIRKPDFRIFENKDADQLRSNCAADQRLCFAVRNVHSLYYLNPKI